MSSSQFTFDTISTAYNKHKDPLASLIDDILNDNPSKKQQHKKVEGLYDLHFAFLFSAPLVTYYANDTNSGRTKIKPIVNSQ